MHVAIVDCEDGSGFFDDAVTRFGFWHEVGHNFRKRA